MRIIFINRFFYPDHSATSQLLSDVAWFLAKEGWAVQVICSRYGYEQSSTAFASAEIVAGVHITRIWTTAFGRGWLPGRMLDYMSFYVSAGWWLLWHLRRDDCLVAKTDPPLLSTLAALIGKIRGARFMNWCQDLFPEAARALGIPGMNGHLGTFCQQLRNWSLRQAQTNIVIGERMAEYVRGQGIRAASVRVIHNWADGNHIQPVDPQDNELRREWGLEQAFVVGYSGNLGRAHDVDTFLQTMEALKDDSDIRFLFIGSGSNLQALKEQVAIRQLSNVLFQPYQPRDQLRFSLGVPDVHFITLHPELEGLIVPSKFYGIAAAGRPTIFIGDVHGEIPNILLDHDCGFSVAIGEVQRLVHVIRQLASDEECRRRMGGNARAVFEERFEAKLAYGHWENVFEKERLVHGTGREQSV